jgi:ribonuclease P protein component
VDPNATVPLQAGFSVSSRNFKKAVDRNRIKRLLREAYRLLKAGLSDPLNKSGKKLVIFVIFTGKELPPYQLVYEKMEIALAKLVATL